MSYRMTRRLAGKGGAEQDFRHQLRAVLCGGQGHWLLAGDREVKVLDRHGERVQRWETARPGWSLAFDGDGGGDGNIWVGEPGQIEIFAPDGHLVDTWRDDDLFRLVTALVVTPDDVFVADAGSRWIHRFDRDRRLVNHIGDRHRKGGFHIPSGVLDFDRDEDGTLVVANQGMHRVERYEADGTARGHFGRFGHQDPADFPGCCNPTNLTLAPGGAIVVSEKAGPRVKVYDREGTLLEVVADDEPFDPACKNMDLAVDPDGAIAVADTVALCAMIFEPAARPETAEVAT